MANEVDNIRKSNLPAYLQDKAKTTRIGNIDSTDLVIPRVKLLQGVSPELELFPDTARAGIFWHSILQEPLGKSLIGIPIVLKKTHVLWAPRGDDRGILARSRDAINWEPPQGEFDVVFKGNKTVYHWKLAPTVAESGLDKFGSSRSDDPNSPPAASLTYEILWYFPEHADLGPSIILNSRGAVKVCQRLLSVIDAKPVDHFYQLYSIGCATAKGPDGEPFHNYVYSSLGYADEADGAAAAQLYERFKDVAFRASDEKADVPNDAPGAGHVGQTAQRSANSKF
jgi:hypothetical protein